MFSQWKKSDIAISSNALLDFLVSIVFLFSIFIPTSNDICKPPQPKELEGLTGMGSSVFLQG